MIPYWEADCSVILCGAEFGGDCVNGVCNGTTGECMCEENFYGDRCDTYCTAAETCSSNGHCFSDGKCECLDGYQGENCQAFCPNNCNSNDVDSHGFCDYLEHMKCLCQHEWCGDDCSSKDCDRKKYIIGGVVGGVGALILVGLGIGACCLWKKQKAKGKKLEEEKKKEEERKGMEGGKKEMAREIDGATIVVSSGGTSVA